MDFDVTLEKMLVDFNLKPRFIYTTGAPAHRTQYSFYALRRTYECLLTNNIEEIKTLNFKTPDELKPESAWVYLLELITKCFEIRDFVLGMYCINEYIEKKYPEHEALQLFADQVNKLLGMLAGKLKKRKQKDVFLLAIDSIRNKDVQYMDYLNGIYDAFTFSRAYSASLYTRAAFRSMLTGAMLFANKSWENKNYVVDLKDSDLIKFLKDDYTLLNLSGFKFLPEEAGTIYPIETTRTKEGKFCSEYKKEEAIKHTTSEIFWKYLCETVKSEKPVFAITLCEEFHMPCVSYWHTKEPQFLDRTAFYTKEKATQENIDRQRKETLAYLDGQLQFLNSFYLSGYQVIVGDHGQMMGEYGHLGGGLTWHDESYHVPLIIRGLKGKTDALFSARDIGELIINLIKEDKVKIQKRDTVVVQRDALYDGKFLKDNFKNSIGEKYIKPFQVIITDKDKLVTYRKDDGFCGEEYFQDDDNKNLFGDPQYNNRIEEIKEAVNGL